MKNEFNFTMLESEKKRALESLESYGTLKNALVSSELANVRPNALHIKEYLADVLPKLTAEIDIEGYAIEIAIGRKAKANAARIADFHKKGKKLRIIVGQTQTSYRRLNDVATLIETLLEVYFHGVLYQNSKGLLEKYKGALKLPSGAPMTKRKKEDRILSALGISEFQGMDNGAITTSFKCDKCGYSYVACNSPKKSQECNKPNCTGLMIGTRLNYNHRSDNIKTDSNKGHWGVNKETVVSGLNPNDPALKFAKGQVKELIYSSLNWSLDEKKEVESLVVQGVETKQAEQVVRTMDIASKKAKLVSFINSLSADQLSGLNKAKLKRYNKEQLIKLSCSLGLNTEPSEGQLNLDFAVSIVDNYEK